MTKSKYAKWYLVGILCCTIAFDIWLDSTDKTTISRYILDLTKGHPGSIYGLLAFGIYLGHQFWPQKR